MTSPTIQLGNSTIIRDASYVPRWRVDYQSDADIALVRLNSSGAEQETVITIDATAGNIAITGDVTVTGTLTTTEADVSYRTVASDVVPEIGRLDAGGVIELLASASGAKAITTDTSGANAVSLGQEVTIFLTARSGGSYTLALSTGTLTFDAALECAKIVRTSLGWNVVSLNGATIV